MENRAKIIALCGKGGVGKTSLSAAIIKTLLDAHPDKRVLAIDADPSVGLATALGVKENGTINDIREEFIQMADSGSGDNALAMLARAKSMILDELVEEGNLAFLAIGRPESAGCYCSVNDYLRDLITMVADKFDFVVIDGEAGIEQINRRVMDKVNYLLLVSDASRKGLDVISKIKDVGDKLLEYEKCGAVINRLDDLSIAERIAIGKMEILAVIGSDNELARYDIEGKSILELPADAKIIQGAKEILRKMDIEVA